VLSIWRYLELFDSLLLWLGRGGGRCVWPLLLEWDVWQSSVLHWNRRLLLQFFYSFLQYWSIFFWGLFLEESLLAVFPKMADTSTLLAEKSFQPAVLSPRRTWSLGLTDPIYKCCCSIPATSIVSSHWLPLVFWESVFLYPVSVVSCPASVVVFVQFMGQFFWKWRMLPQWQHLSCW
jgi:hypothetical protein